MEAEKIKAKLLQLDTKRSIQFIILFGSVVQGTNTPLSDIDIAVYYQGNPRERFDFRRRALGKLPDTVDIQIFQDLPLAVQKEVLAGKVLYYRDFQLLFDECMKVIKEFNTFEKYYDEYFAELKKEVEA